MTAMAARLADLPGVLIGTANQAQGLEREAVVVIHPLAGYREAPSFATDPDGYAARCLGIVRTPRSSSTPAPRLSCDTPAPRLPTHTALAIQQRVLTVLLGAA